MTTKTEMVRILEEAGCSPDVIEHCREVASLAVEIARKVRAAGHELDLGLVENGALLHDLGRCRTHGIFHAVEGFKLSREKGIELELSEIIKRHIGAGISRYEARKLGLPDDDYFPRSLEEKIVAHADNLVRGTQRITLEERIAGMRKKQVGEEVVQRVKKLAEEIEKMSLYKN